MPGTCSTLILDLDGTISDPSLGIARSTNHALSSCGFQSVDAEAVHKEWTSHSSDDTTGPQNEAVS